MMGNYGKPQRGDMFVAVGKPKAQPTVNDKINICFGDPDTSGMTKQTTNTNPSGVKYL